MSGIRDSSQSVEKVIEEPHLPFLGCETHLVGSHLIFRYSPSNKRGESQIFSLVSCTSFLLSVNRKLFKRLVGDRWDSEKVARISARGPFRRGARLKNTCIHAHWAQRGS